MINLTKYANKDVNIILANDPDADRVALLEREDNKWHSFCGNEIGNVLCSYILEKTKDIKNRLVATSTVSSIMLSQ